MLTAKAERKRDDESDHVPLGSEKWAARNLPSSMIKTLSFFHRFSLPRFLTILASWSTVPSPSPMAPKEWMVCPLRGSKMRAQGQNSTRASDERRESQR